MKTIYVVVYKPFNEDIEVLASFSDKKDAQQFGVYYITNKFEDCDCTYKEEEWGVVDDFLEYWDTYIFPTKLDRTLIPRVKKLTTKISTLRCQLDTLEKEYHELMGD